MLGDGDRKLAATCGTCGRQLTLAEFRACSGVGHFCTAHLHAEVSTKTKATRPSRRARASPPSRGRSRRVSESGAIEYPCKGQFASNGVIRRGKITSDHPSCFDGGVVFVCNDIGHGPGEIVTLFINDPVGRSLAERTGYTCQ